MERAGAGAGPQSLGWTERAESSGHEFPALGTVEVSDAPPGQHVDRGLVHGGVDLLPRSETGAALRRCRKSAIMIVSSATRFLRSGAARALRPRSWPPRSPGWAGR